MRCAASSDRPPVTTTSNAALRRNIAAFLLCLGVGLGAASCGGSQAPATDTPQSAQSTEHEPSPQAAAQSTATSRWKVPDTDPQPGSGHDFKAEVAALRRVLACGGRGPIPKPLDAAVVNAYCDRLRPAMQGYRDNYLSKAKPFFAAIRPKDLPPAVVYPFGGGDLNSALMVFPDAREYTTISLEFSGDPRPILKQADAKKLEQALAVIGDAMATLFRGDWNWTRNMAAAQEAGAPEQLAYALAAMVVHNYEPISLRYFHLRRDGTIKYVDDAEIAASEGKKPKRTRNWGPDPAWSPAFSHMEIRFQSLDGGPIKVYRHLAYNLADAYLTDDPHHLTRDPSLLAHLVAKGRVSAMTRAASHLLWFDEFTLIRNYLTAHLEWMPSDSTGVPPPFAAAAGLEQDTYGVFTAAYEPSDQGERRQYNDAFRELFASNPQKRLDFLFGYPDNAKNAHLVVTYRP